MKNIKITLAELLSYIAALLFGFICFLSFTFLEKGVKLKGILAALGISIFLLLIILLLKKIKAANRDFKKNTFIELLIFAIYILVAVTSIIPYSHYFTVFSQKKELKEKIVTDIEKIKKMFSAYDEYADKRIAAYEYELTTAIRGKNSNNSAYLSEGFRNNGESENDQKKRLIHIFQEDIKPAQYDSIKRYALSRLEYTKSKAANWIVPIEFMRIIERIVKDANSWVTALKRYSGSSQKAAIDPPFDYDVSFSSIEKEITKRKPPGIPAVITGLILHVLLLLPYFFKGRNSRHAGFFNELFKNKSKDAGIGKVL